MCVCVCVCVYITHRCCKEVNIPSCIGNVPLKLFELKSVTL